MSKKTIALILSLVAITVILFLMTVSVKNSVNKPVPKVPAIPVLQTYLVMNPGTTTLPANGKGTIAIVMDTRTNEVNAVQLDISYDPKILTNIAIEPSGYFTGGEILLNKIDKKNARIILFMGVPHNQPSFKGKSTIATISFTVLPTLNKNVRTYLAFTPRTIVSAKGINISVIKQATGTIINLSH